MNTNNKHYRVQLRSMKLINSKEQSTGGLQQQCSKFTISLQGPGKRLSWSTQKTISFGLNVLHPCSKVVQPGRTLPLLIPTYELSLLSTRRTSPLREFE